MSPSLQERSPSLEHPSRAAPPDPSMQGASGAAAIVGAILLLYAGCAGDSVTTGPEEPETPGSVWKERTFEAYGSTQELREATGDFGGEQGWDKGLDGPKGGIHLDREVAYEPGGLTRSMRYDWVNQGTESVTRGRGIRLPEKVSEVWVEIVMRWSSNFTSCHPDDPPCDHKTIFIGVEGLHGQWRMNFGSNPRGTINLQAPFCHSAGSGDCEGPDDQFNGDASADAFDYFDDEWHVVRWYVRHSTDGETKDGRTKLWLDGEQVADFGNFATPTGPRSHAVILGRNKDKGRDAGTESLWIGRVRMWNQDPGW